MNSSENQRNGRLVASHRDAAYAAAFSPDGTRVAVGLRDGTIFEWPTDAASKAVRYASVSGRVTSCCYAASSGSLAFSNTTDIFIWPPGAPQPSHRFPHPGVEAIAIDPNGEFVFSGDKDGRGKLWSVSKQAELASAVLDVRGLIDAQWIAATKEVLVGTAAGEVILLQADDLTVHRRIVVSSKSDLVYRARLSPDRSTFAASYQVVRAGPIAASMFISPLNHDYYEIAVWESERDRPATRESLVGHFNWIGALAFSPDGSLLASGSADHGIKIWDPYQRRVLSENRVHRGTIHDLAFSPDGQQLVSASADGDVRLWDVPDISTTPAQMHRLAYARQTKLDLLQSALELLLAIKTQRELEIALDEIAQIADLSGVSTREELAIPTGSLRLSFEDLGGLNVVLQIRQERAFREGDDATAGRCSFILRYVHMRMSHGLEAQARQAFATSSQSAESSSPAAPRATAESPAPRPEINGAPAVPLETVQAAVSAIFQSEASGNGSGSLEQLIQIAPSRAAILGTLLHIPGLGDRAPLSDLKAALACARLAYRFAVTKEDPELVEITGNLLLGALGQSGQNAEGIALAHELLSVVKNPFYRIDIESMLGNLYQNSGQPLAGIEVLNRAADELGKLTVPEEHRATLEAHVLNNLAVIHAGLGDRARERVALDRAYSSSKRVADPNLHLNVLQNLGGYYIATGDQKSAERCFTEILEHQSISPQLRMKAICDLALVHCRLGDVDRAQVEAEQASDMAKKAKVHSVEARALTCLAKVADQKNNREESKAFLQRALDVAKRASDEGLITATEIKLAEAELVNNPNSEFAYGLLRSAGQRALAERDTLEVLDQGRGLHTTVKRLADRIIELAVARGSDEDAWATSESSRAYLLLKQMTVRRRKKTNAEAIEVKPPELETIRSALATLGPRAVLICYHIGEDRSWTFLVRPTGKMVVIPVEMTTSDLERVVRTYDREVRRYQTYGDIGEHWLQDTAPLVAQLEPHLRSGDYLIVIPSGPLFALPWHAMSIGGQRIAQRWPVSYLPTASLLLTHVAQGQRPKSCTILASVFTKEAETVGGILNVPIVVSDRKGDYLAALPAAEMIHISMHGVFSSHRSEMSGLVVGDTAPLALFYSAVAKPPHARTTAEDAILKRSEELKERLITATDLEAIELHEHATVVLSACESGLSLIDESADPMGLIRALLLSGAGTIVATFWRVEPDRTSELMRVFYEALTKSSEPLWDKPAEALRRAQIHLSAKFPHTFNWGSFYVTGGLRAGCAGGDVCV
jgi:CHAT domain-containing protein